MTVKELLSQGININERIRTLQEEKMKLRALIEQPKALQYDAICVRSSESSDRVDSVLDKVGALDRRIDAHRERLVDVINRIHDLIDPLTDADEYNVLHKRYILGYTWQRIADELHYDERQVYRIHGNALSKLNLSVNVIECQYQGMI